MGKYFLQQGGEPSAGAEQFNGYVDQLLATQQEEPQYIQQPDAEEPQDSDYIKGLREYDAETNVQSQEQLFNEKLDQLNNIFDQKLAEFSDKQQEFDWFATEEGNDYLAQTYDTQQDSMSANDWPPNVPYSTFQSQMQPQQAALGKLANLNFKSSGESGTANIGPYGVQIGNEIAGMLGYTPTYNSIYRTKANNDALIKAGKPAVKNSYHLSGNAVDVNPRDWKKLSKQQQAQIKQKYDVIYHDNHFHIEPK